MKWVGKINKVVFEDAKQRLVCILGCRCSKALDNFPKTNRKKGRYGSQTHHGQLFRENYSPTSLYKYLTGHGPNKLVLHCIVAQRYASDQLCFLGREISQISFISASRNQIYKEAHQGFGRGSDYRRFNQTMIQRRQPRIPPYFDQYTACLFSSAGDRSNIILGELSSNHKEQGKFKDNVIKQQFV